MDVDFGVASCVTYADTFYVGVDGVGIFAYAEGEWSQVYAGAREFTDAISTNKIPLFGTSDGTVITGPNWTETLVSSGRIKLAYSDKLYVVVNSVGTLEIFAGADVNSLVSLGTNQFDEFYVTASSYDAINKCIVVSGYATDDQSPFFYTFKQGMWTMVISDLDTHASALCRNALTAGSTLYTTKDYLTFVRLHDFGNFVPNALIYA